ncbi:MAG: CBS domain-containing protein [Candidatus Omnitrophota bacterium]
MELKYSENYYIRSLLNKVKIQEIMTKKVICLNQDEPFSHAAKKFQEYEIRHLPVLDNKNKLVGIITQRDLYRICSPRKREDGTWFYDQEILDDFILKHVMTQQVTTLSSENSVADALLIMADKKYGCIPIVDKSQTLCGIISQIDILQIGAQILREGQDSAKKKNSSAKT